MALELRYEYDGMGRQTKIDYPDGTSSTSVYDDVGHLVQTVDVLGQVTRYEYDDEGNRTKAVMPNGATTSYEYDAYGRLVREISPDRGETTYGYSTAGELVSKQDAEGNLQQTEYDLLGRKISESWVSQPELNTHYEYDSCRVGKLCKATYHQGETIYRYNDDGLLAEKTQTMNGVTLTLENEYDDYGRIVSKTYPSGRKVSYHYAEHGHEPNAISVDGSPFITDIEVNAANQLTGWKWADGSTYQRTYDQDGRITGLPLAGLTQAIDYNELGHIIRWSDGQQVKNYDYDRIGRLSAYSESNPAGIVLQQQLFDYDANGNRTQQVNTLNTEQLADYYTIKENTNQLSYKNQKHYTYDANGNLTQDGEHSYHYNAKNQLDNVDDQYFYFYGTNGQRIQKVTPQGSIFYAWDDNRLFAEYDQNGDLVSETIYLGSIPVGVIKDSELFRVFASQDNAPRAIINQSDEVVWRWESAPFGEDSADSSPKSESGFVYNLRYPGQYYDAETGLNYNHHRYYDASIGRYTQSDPMGLDGGLNTYIYANNNPITYIDSSGLKYTKTITTYNIQINASIALFGASTPTLGYDLALRWRTGIMNDWHAGGTRRYQGTKLTNLYNKSVTFNVQMPYDTATPYSSPGAGPFYAYTNHWMAAQNKGTQNAVQVEPAGFRSVVEYANGWRGLWASDEPGRVASHEFGHILGLADHYVVATNQTCPGHVGHLMGDLGPLQQHELDNMVDLVPGGC
ncbi:MAG: RHS repeat-associated core domain-containing protein [Thiothrix sp.]|nr:RHS repeat-associated core domain-containing protein [Thiothrix sp.]